MTLKRPAASCALLLALALPGLAALKPPVPAARTQGLPLLAPTTGPITVPVVMERFTAFDKDLKSLSADFKQSVKWEESGVDQSIEGTVEYAKPDLLRLEHSSPERQTLVADGSWLWVYRPSTNQVIQTRLEDWKKSEPMAQGLIDFGNYADLLKRYDVAIATVSLAGRDGHRDVTVVLRPKEKSASSDFTLKLKLSTRDFFPAETDLAVGQIEAHCRFSGVRYNPPLKEDRFVFTPPQGADVFQNFRPPKAPAP